MTAADTLAALSEAATEGPWQAIGSDPAEGFDCFWIKAQPSPMLRGFTKEIGTVNGHQSSPEQTANAAFIVALVNAYRTGQLVPVPSVEAVAFQIWHQLGQIEENVRAGALTQDEVRTIATAVIAAMKEGRE